jgi:hypothetical protein
MTILVLAPDLSSMQLGILRHAIAEAPDIDVMARAADLPRAPDVVITGSAEAEDESSVQAFLDCWPKSRVVALNWRGARTSLVELRPCWTELGELGPSELVDVIRAAAARPRVAQR